MKREKINKIFGFVLIIIWAIVTILLIYLINKLFFREVQALVYKTKTGNRYHSKNCYYLHSSCIKIGIKQAKAEGLTACLSCSGKSCETIVVDNYGISCVITFLIELIGIILFKVVKLLSNKKRTNQTR